MIIECPVCNKKTYHYITTEVDEYGQALSPAEGHCESCRFEYSEYIGHPEEQQAKEYKQRLSKE